MKYKNIPAALHNFGESFVSLMNYFDDTYVVDVLPIVLRDLPGHELRILFPQGTLIPDRAYPAVLLESVAHYASRFPEHLVSHNIDAASVTGATLIVRGTRLGIRCRFEARDDRGREYDVAVS